MPLRKKIYFLPLIIYLFSSFFVQAQKIHLRYKIMQGNDEIGWLTIDKKDSANISSIKMLSETKKKMLLTMNISEQQEAIFQNGIMTSSFIYRKVNDDVKVNKRTTIAGNNYTINDDGKISQIALKNVHSNQLSLYFSEPSHGAKVYSDFYQGFITVQKTAEHAYQVKLPDGNTNFYTYANGVCTRLKLVRSLFTVEFVLAK